VRQQKKRKKTLVSVIVPCYNCEKTIARALDSVLNQTLKSIEILVCDDASTDSTKNIVQKYLEKDKRIKLLKLYENQGAGAARNLGLVSAIGDYIAFLDSDDEWLPNKLELQLKCLNRSNSSAKVCFCGAVIIRNKNNLDVKKYIPYKSWEVDTFKKFILGKISFLTPTIMFDRNCIKKIGLMVPQMKRNQDVEFLLRLFRYYKLIVIQDELAVIHLITKMSKKNIYKDVIKASSFHLRHKEMISSELGENIGLKYHSLIYDRIIFSAFHERKYCCAVNYIVRRLKISYYFSLAEVFMIFKALIHGILKY
jgi:glycosyltransferase involved in cell wall biosynthesis